MQTENIECVTTGTTLQQSGKKLEKDIKQEKITGIYKIINKINQKYYVGGSKNIYNRWYRHKSDIAKNVHHNDHLQRAWKLYGSDNFYFIIVERFDNSMSEEELLAEEQKYLDIAKLEPEKCYNISFIAGRVIMTDEVKRKISIANKGHSGLKGDKNPNYGKSPSKEIIEKIKTKLAWMRANGLLITPPPSAECRLKMSIARSGKNNQNYDYTVYTFKNTKTNEIFIGTRNDFYKNKNYDARTIRKFIRGQYPSYKGWIVVK